MPRAMAQIFHPAMSTAAKATIFGALLVIAGVAIVAWEMYQSPYITKVGVVRVQPVPFSHEHHVAGLGIDCRYCHTSVETSAFAGLPATKVCMTCHSQVWTNAEMLEPVRASWKSGTPLQWTRVHDLPDYAYFNHSIHVQKGVGCATCHGRVDEMPLMAKAQSLQMMWCLDCHRHPEQYVRPYDKVFDMAWKWPDDVDPIAEGNKLVEEYHIRKGQLTNCSVCHR